ncbi:hypothetical protein [Maribacter sp. HTCC2170]|uniref:hypothetical protein n=1 Tax=Maribacter sp. (strain HTCC2170 / KCCM 42371) TaxID=313603 RepID=UPI0002FF83F2|nr:hypothetical protein [Maribacter sp. HTCC2170]
MISDKKYTKTDQTRKIEELYRDSQQWKSHLHLMQDELTFIDHLLNSYIFEPNTPNLFERLQDFLQRLIKAKNNKQGICEMISKHEKDLGGMIQCTNDSCDNTYYQKHEKMKAETVSCIEDFRSLKTEIFEYAGGILKKRKPSK